MLEPIINLLGEHKSGLTENEQRLVAVLTSDPAGAAYLSGRELAQAAGVHESSAVRLAQKLGFDGYPAFRRALRKEQQDAAMEPSQRVARTLAEVADGELWRSLLSHEVESMLACEQHISQKQLDEAAQMLAGARQIHLWATGNAKILTDLLDRRLRSAGLPVRNISHEGRELAERLVDMDRRDVLLAFAFRRVPKALPVLLRHARDCGTRSLLIADTLAHTVDLPAHLVLAAPRGDSEKFLTLSVPMLITNALVLTLLARTRKRAMHNLHKLQTLRRELGDAV
ncbi:MAG: MurR/RpiR family transcriptional regulator [Pseudomonadota bacterium]|nr:MurR/RpiR family transcriptional regulator [Pseudomonadota bacterium]